MDTNRAVAMLVAGLLVSTAGCTQLIAGDTTFTADGAAVDDYEELGYELDRTQWRNVTRTVDAGGQEQEITVANRIRVYLNRDGSGDPVAGMALVTSPQVSVAGQAANPVDGWSNERVLREFSDEFESYGSIDDIDELDSETEEFAGVETELTTFEATAESDDGATRELHITVAKVTQDGDVIIGVGVHNAGDEDNAEAVETLFEKVDP